jgi:hypothetical protein
MYRIDGEILSVGSLSYLQQKYCRSYFVEVSIASPEMQVAVVNAFLAEGQNAVQIQDPDTIP